VKLDLLTNATVVFQLKSSSSNEVDKESKGLDYHEDEDQLDEEQEETGETTTNCVLRSIILVV
jgi:hypothetical protein